MNRFFQFYFLQLFLALIPVVQIKLFWILFEPEHIANILQAQLISFVLFSLADNLDGFTTKRHKFGRHADAMSLLILRRMSRLTLAFPIALLLLLVAGVDAFVLKITSLLAVLMIFNPAQYARNYLSHSVAFLVDFFFKILILLVFLLSEQITNYLFMFLLSMILISLSGIIKFSGIKSIGMIFAGEDIYSEVKKVTSVTLGALCFNFVPILATLTISNSLVAAHFLSFDRLIRGLLIVTEPIRLFILRRVKANTSYELTIFRIILISLVTGFIFVFGAKVLSDLGFFYFMLESNAHNEAYFLCGTFQIIIGNISLLALIANNKFTLNIVVLSTSLAFGLMSIVLSRYFENVFIQYLIVEAAMLLGFLLSIFVSKNSFRRN